MYREIRSRGSGEFEFKTFNTLKATPSGDSFVKSSRSLQTPAKRAGLTQQLDSILSPVPRHEFRDANTTHHAPPPAASTPQHIHRSDGTSPQTHTPPPHTHTRTFSGAQRTTPQPPHTHADKPQTNGLTGTRIEYVNFTWSQNARNSVPTNGTSSEGTGNTNYIDGRQRCGTGDKFVTGTNDIDGRWSSSATSSEVQSISGSEFVTGTTPPVANENSAPVRVACGRTVEYREEPLLMQSPAATPTTAPAAAPT
eukprot:Lankesteria_metandrocarpae@DN11024_c0_g1_i1.p1